MEKKTRLRFTYDDEIAMLREFLANNPSEDAQKWEVIRQHVEEITGKNFLLRTLKKHLQLLIETYADKDSVDNKKSGVEEVYNERNHLLQEVTDICRGTNVFSIKSKTSKEKQISEKGCRTRENVAMSIFSKPLNEEECRNLTEEHNYIQSEMDTSNVVCEIPELTVSESHEEDTNQQEKNKEEDQNKENVPKRNILVPSRKRTAKCRPLRKNALDYIQEKNDKDNSIRKKELELEEKKLELEERKLAIEERRIVAEEKKLQMELDERQQKLDLERQRMKMEIDERQSLNSLINSQQKIIETLLATTNNNVKIN